MTLLDERYHRLSETFYGVQKEFITELCLDIELSMGASMRLIGDAAWYYDVAKHHNYVNVTPNGMIMPKIENVHIYNSFAKNFFIALKEINVFDKFVAWNVPAIRYKQPAFTSENAQRPRASEYAHSDSWLGWDQSAIVFMIPLLGDCKGNWVQFFSHELDETWIETLPSFTCPRALDMIAQCEGMPWRYEPGHIYPNDIGMVHQTRREDGCGWRVSAEIVGYLDYPKSDSFAAHTAYGKMVAQDIINDKRRFKASLKMGEIGEYSETGRALELSIE